MTAVPIELPDEPGWSTVSVGHLHVLVRAGGALVDRVRVAAQDGDLDDVLDALSADGVRATPDFVAVLEGAPLRVVTRGTAYAVAVRPAGLTELRSTGRGPWVDQDADPDVTAVTLLTGAIPAPRADSAPGAGTPPSPGPAAQEPVPQAPTQVADTQLPPTSEPVAGGGAGWKLPSVFGRGRADEVAEPAETAAAEAAPAGVAPPAEPAAAAVAPPAAPAAGPTTAEPTAPEPTAAEPATEVAEVEDLPSYDHLFGATQHDRPSYIEKHDTQGISEPPIGHAPIESAGGFDPRDSLAEQKPPAHPEHTLAPPRDTTHPDAVPQPSAAEPPPPPPPVKGGLIDSVPWRSGGSNVPAPDPAPRPTPVTSPTPATPPASVIPPAASAPVAGPHSSRPGSVPLPPAPAVRPAPAAPDPVPPVSSVPAAAAPVTPPAPAGPPPAPSAPAPASPAVSSVPPAAPVATEGGDDADATVDRSALLAGRATVSGPTVLAVLCPAGHTSPPHSGVCRLCGREIPPQQPFQTARPPLGLLRLASGDVVQLDRGVLLGRSPKVNAELAAADRPHLVKVSSAQNDISRNHVEIVLEGWHVLIRDLGSTNGTTVALPGQHPVRLRPSDQQVIEPGTVITLADEVSLTYEVGA